MWRELSRFTSNRWAIAFGILVGVLLVASPSKGPDFDFYLDWSFATLSGDIFDLRAGLLSPLGVPLSQWSVGPGLLFAVSWIALGGIRPEGAAAMAAGAFSSLVFWASLLLLLRRAVGNDKGLVLFGLSAAFLGTHAGFYSLNHASESMSLGPGALMIVLLTSRRPWNALQCLWMGASAGLLVLVRVDYIIYAAPALLLAAVRASRSRGDLGQSQRALRLGLLALPLALAMLPMIAVNRWMTGNPLRSPYVFGDGGFRSLDWTSPEMLAVVGNPHHGLIPYHPLYGLGFLALVWCVWRAPSREERLLWAAGLGSVVAHLYLQASWYAWWLGPLTFGMRALSLATIVAVPALARSLAQTSPGSAARRLWLLASTLACIWSTLLLLQKYTHFYAWADLWHRQVTFARALPHSTEAISLVAGLACTAVLVALMMRGRKREWALLSPAVLLSGLSVSYLLSRACRR